MVNTGLNSVYIPSDGKFDVTQALAKGARTGGALIREDCKVLAIRHDGERVTGVKTDANAVISLASIGATYRSTPANISTS